MRTLTINTCYAPAQNTQFSIDMLSHKKFRLVKMNFKKNGHNILFFVGF